MLELQSVVVSQYFNEQYFINVILALTCIIVLLICRHLWRRKDVPHLDLLYDDSSPIIQDIISNCHSLNEKYIPTYLWGKSGHLQSLIHTFKGRFGKIPDDFSSERYEILAPDGSIVSYDIFEPDATTQVPVIPEMVLIVPGICNHSESRYIRAISFHLNSHGFRVAVFNHTGALKSVKLRRPRIFTYGHTQDLDTVVKHLLATQKVDKFIGLGMSLGGNILMKFLGEEVKRQDVFHFAVSVCQGYDISEASILFSDWQNCRRIYNYGLTRNVLKVINQHKEDLARHFQSEEIPTKLNWKDIFSAKELKELDENFTLKMCKENNMEDFYRYNSSSQFMDKIALPMLILNAQDDPIVPEKLHKYPKQLMEVNKNVLFVRPPHGGHLGFFEGGVIIPNSVTWLDRMLAEFMQVALGVVKARNGENNSKTTKTTTSKQ